MGDELTPFYRISARQELTARHMNQHPRIKTNHKGWITERQFVDEWRMGKEIPRVRRIESLLPDVGRGD
jgi:hypothetical protein